MDWNKLDHSKVSGCWAGLWIFVPTNQTVSITGTSSTTCTVDLQEGWNMIGSVYGQSIAASSVFSGHDQISLGREQATKPQQPSTTGQGYWVLGSGNRRNTAVVNGPVLF